MPAAERVHGEDGVEKGERGGGLRGLGPCWGGFRLGELAAKGWWELRWWLRVAGEGRGGWGGKRRRGWGAARSAGPGVQSRASRTP